MIQNTLKLISIFVLLGVLSSCGSAPKKVKTAKTIKTSKVKQLQQQVESGQAQPNEGSAEQESDNSDEAEVSDLKKAINEKRFTDASKIGTTLLAQNPDDIKALNILAMLQFSQGKPDLAKIFLARALKANDKSVETLNNLAVVLWSQGKKKDAISKWKKAMAISSVDPIVMANLGQYYAQAKEYKRAQAALEVAAKEKLENPSFKSAWATTMVANGRIDEADDVYDDYVDDNPNDWNVLFNYSIFLVDVKKDLSAADKMISKLKLMGIPQEFKTKVETLETKVREGKK